MTAQHAHALGEVHSNKIFIHGQTAPYAILVVDRDVADVAQLLAGLAPGVLPVRLERSGLPLAQIADVLEACPGVKELHILSHGEAGAFVLGGERIDGAALERHATALGRIGAALGREAEIALWSCATAQGEEGEQFLHRFEELTGATVHASKHPVGNAAQGGIWEFGIKAPFSAAAMKAWPHTLPTFDGNGSINASDQYVESDNGDGVTMTLTYNTTNALIGVSGGAGGANGSFTYAANAGVTSVTVTFSQGVDITSFQYAEVDDGAEPGNYIFTVVTGSGTTVILTEADFASINSFEGVTVTPTDWTSVTEFTFSTSAADMWPAFDTLVYSVSSSPLDLTGLSGIIYTEGDSATVIDSDVTLTAPSDSYNGGTITVTGLLAEDTVSVQNEGTGTGEVGFDSSNVSYEGVVIGTLSGGAGADLTITLNASATTEAVEAVIENLTYVNISDAPTASRTLTVNVTDEAGGQIEVTDPVYTEVSSGSPVASLTMSNTQPAPEFVDIDNDGDLDLFVAGNGGGSTVQFFENTGTASSPTFTERTGSNNPLNSVSASFSDARFVDIDTDGDFDVFIGKADGTIEYWENTGDNTSPAFAVGTNPLAAANIPFAARMDFVDIDNDGDMDMFAGNSGGYVYFFENTGTSTSAVFTQNNADNPFNSIDFGGYTQPSFFDVDNDGDQDMVLAVHAGNLLFYRNTGTNTNPAFTQQTGSDNPFDGITVSPSTRAKAAFGDLDNDGGLDIVMGDTSSINHYYQGSFPTGVDIEITVSAENDDPAASGVPSDVTVTEDVKSDLDLSAITLTDADSGSANITVTLQASAGTLSASSGGSVTVTGANSATLTLTGAVADIDTYLNTASNIRYAGVANVNGGDAATITITANDGGNSGTGGGSDVTLGTVNVDITAVDDIPTVGGFDSLSYTEGGGAVFLDADARFQDGDADFDGATLVVSGLLAEDTVSINNEGTGAGEVGFSGGTITYGGTTIGTATGGAGASLNITFNTNASVEAVESVFQNLTYTNSSGTPTASRSLLISYTDGSGQEASTGPFWTELTDSNNPLNGFNEANYGRIAVGDLDDDGDLDFIAGDTSGEFYYYRNEGTASDPSYVRYANVATNPLQNLGIQNGGLQDVVSPTLVDIDNDGDLDIFVGLDQGSNTISFLRNDGTASSPSFTEVTGSGNPFDSFSLGAYAAIGFVDIDDDGDLDAVIAVDTGLTFWRNDGTASSPSFTYVTDPSSNPFSDLSSLAYGSPSFADFDNDGDYDMLTGIIGSDSGVHYYENTGTASAATFVEQTGSDLPFTVLGDFGYPGTAVGDFDNDGDQDLVVVTANATYHWYENTPSTSLSIDVSVTGTNDAPVFTGLDGTPTFTEGGSAVQLDADVSIADAELDALNGGSGDYAGAAVSVVRSGGTNADDVFSVLTGGNITVSGGPYGGGTISAGGNVIAIIDDADDYDEIQITFVDNGTTPTTALVNEVMQAIRYSNVSNDPGASVDLSWTFSDGNSGDTQGTGDNPGTDTGTVTVTLTSVDDAPTLTATGQDPAFTEGGSNVDIFSTVTADTVETDQTFTGMTLTVTNVSDGADETLVFDGSSIQLTNGTAVSTATNGLGVSVSVTGSTATVSFTGASLTEAQFQTLVDGMAYSNASDNPTTAGNRVVTITGTTDDGDTLNGGAFASAPNLTSTISLTGVNDAPVLDSIDGDSASEVVSGNGVQDVTDLNDVVVTNVDSANYNGGFLTLTQDSGTTNGNWAVDGTTVAAGADGTIAAGEDISVGGVVIGTVDGTNDGQGGTTLEINFNANATSANIQTLIRNLTYDAPSGIGARGFTLTLNDGDGTANGGDQDTAASFTITVMPNPPVLSNIDGDSVTFTEGDSGALLDANSDMTLTDADSTDFDGGNVTVSYQSGQQSEDRIEIDTSGTVSLSAGMTAGSTVWVGGTAIGAIDTGATGGAAENLVITLNSDATPARVQELVRAFSYNNAGDDDPSDGDREIRISVTDASSNAAVGQADVTVNVDPVNDAASFGGTLTGGLNEDTDTVGGSATVTDADGADSFTANASVTGTYGDLSIAANGDWVYDLDEANTDVQALAAGDTLGDTLTVTSDDGTTQDIVITITGVNDTASFGGTLTGGLNEDADTVGGTATVSDVDTGESVFTADTVTGTYGDLSITANGDWVYDLDEANTDVQALNAGDTLGDTLTVQSADGTAQDIVITINGANDAATFGGDLTGGLNEDTDTVGGSATVTDTDGADSFTANASVTGTYGDLSIAANGDWVYDLDEANTDVQALAAGDTLGDALTVTSDDGTTQDIVITITGVNDAASFGGDLAGGLNEDADTVGGTATVSDIDGADSFTANASVTGTYGDLTIAANGDWVYDLDEANTDVQALAAGDTLGDTLTVQSADGTAQDIVITINGANDAATFGGDLTGGLNEDTDTVGGTATVADIDAGEGTFTANASVSGIYGDLVIAANGDWVYDLDEANTDVQALAAGDTLGDTLTVTSDDGTTQDIVITITGVNDTPSFGGTLTGALSEDTDTLGGTATVTDVDTGESVLTADTVSGTYGDLSIAANGDWVYDLDEANSDVQSMGAGDTLGDMLTVQSADGTSQTITITINGANDAPQSADASVSANEGEATVFSAADFAFTDVDDGDTLVSIRIDTLPAAGVLQLSGVAVTAGQVISAANIGNLTYTSADDDDTTRSFTFSVNDGTDWCLTPSTMSIDVSSGNDAPHSLRLATSGVTENVSGAFVGTLSAIDPEGDPVSFIVSDSRFRIDGNRLYLASGTSLDYETSTSITVRVSARDPEGLNGSAFFDIPVIDVVNEGGTQTGTSGNDTLRGSAGGDTLRGGAGNDLLNGGAGDDRIETDGGDTGNDIIVGGQGNDFIRAGSGDDFIIGDGATDGVTQQSLDENGNPDETGTDTIRGGNGNDTILGGGWNDDLVNDNGMYDDGEEVETDPEANYIWTGAGRDIAVGSRGNDEIGGSTGQDTLKGMSGDDTLYGNEDNDSVLGGAGNDLLYGGEGDDTLDGGAGDDRIWAGAGNDLLTGGDGADTFAFGASSGTDTITDFDLATDALEFFGHFDAADDVIAASTETIQDGNEGVLIDLGSGESVFIMGLTLNELSGAQMTF